ncbi:MAG: hypothetical protein Q7T74_01750 [Candidatus Saccharibacteria bacterium]|nr:hypothetical protein [Candidatus Saccharibacteria bacterium]
MRSILKNIFRRKRNKKGTLAGLLIFALTVPLFLFVFVFPAQGAVRTWDGGGADGTCGGAAGDGNKWSCALNWSTDTLPGASDVATFDGTSTKDATIDAGFTGSVAGVDINSGYTGTITAARSLTVGSSNFDQASGTWAGGAQTLDINDGSFTVSGGVHTATTGTWTVERSFTSSGGTLTMTGATVTFDGSTTDDDSTVTCTGSLGGSVVIAKTSGITDRPDFTLAAGCTITVTSIDSDMAILTVNGTLNHTGSTFNVDTGLGSTSSGAVSVGNGGTITYSGTNITLEGSLTQNGTWDLSGKTITFDGSETGDDSTVTCTGSLGGSVVIAKTADIVANPDFTLAAGCTITVTSIDSDMAILTVNGTLNHTGSTFNVDASAGSSNSGAVSVGNGGTITYSGTAITLEGSLTQSGTWDLTGKTITFDGNHTDDDSTVTCTGSLGGSVVIAKTADIVTNPAFTLAAGCTITVTSINSVMGILTVNGTLNHTGSTFNVDSSAGSSNSGAVSVGAAGTITYSGSAITIEGSLTQSGTWDLSGKTITFDGNHTDDDSTVTCTGSLGGSVVIAKTADIVTYPDFTLAAGCTITVTSINSTMGTLTVNGTLNHTGNTFNVDASAGSSGGGSVNVANGGTVTYSDTAITLEGSLTQSGTWDLSGKTITFDGSASDDDSTISCASPIQGNVIINKTDAGGLTVLGSNCTIQGNFTRTDGVISNPGSAYILTVEGNFSTSTTDAFGGANMTLNFGGPRPQTFTQNAGSLSTPITINKGGFYALTLATALTLDATGNNLTINDGEFNNASFLATIPGTLTVNDKLTQETGNITFGTLTVGANGKYVNTSTGDIVVGAGGVSNSGTITMGNQNTCGGSDTISITSSSGGVQRDWTGAGTFNMFDLTVTDQAGSATITAYSSTPSNVGANWTFASTCPDHLTPARLGNGARLQSGVRLK